MANGTSTSDIPVTVAYVNAAVSFILVIIVLVGNFFIVLIFIKFKKVRDLNNLAVTLLSLCDLLRGAVVMTTKIYNQLTLATSLIEPICTMTALSSAFTFIFNPQLLALIAFIRYRIITPGVTTSFQVSNKIFKICICFIFLVSLSFALLPILGVGTYDYSKSHGVCFTDWSPKNKVFRTIFYIIVIGLAFPTLTFCYSMLFFQLRKHKQNILSNYNVRQQPGEDVEQPDKKATMFKKLSRDHGRKKSSASSSNGVQMTTFSELNSRDRDQKPSSPKVRDDIFDSNLSSMEDSSYDDKRIKEQKKRVAKKLSQQEYQITKLMIMIFVAYCVCWIPAAVVNVVALSKENSVPDLWLYVIVTMVELKSALNPLIYGLGNRKYKRAFKKLIRRYCRFYNRPP